MIKSFKHKGLEKFANTDSKADIIPQHAKKIKIILQFLDAAEEPEAMNMPGMDWHPLKGDLKGFYSVSVNGNWRIIFRFKGNDAIDVNYIDYH